MAKQNLPSPSPGASLIAQPPPTPPTTTSNYVPAVGIRSPLICSPRRVQLSVHATRSVDAVACNAPGRTRTYNPRFRRPMDPAFPLIDENRSPLI